MLVSCARPYVIRHETTTKFAAGGRGAPETSPLHPAAAAADSEHRVSVFRGLAFVYLDLGPVRSSVRSSARVRSDHVIRRARPCRRRRGSSRDGRRPIAGARGGDGRARPAGDLRGPDAPGTRRERASSTARRRLLHRTPRGGVVMGVKLLQIVFDDGDDDCTVSFEPGQTIAGRVTVVTSDSVKMRCTYM